MTHKHAEYIKAWLDGETVEVRTGGSWCEVGCLEDFDHCYYSEFRKKPTQWYRVGLFKYVEFGGPYTVIINSDDAVEHYENHIGFIKWLTDRVYYEV